MLFEGSRDVLGSRWKNFVAVMVVLAGSAQRFRLALHSFLSVVAYGFVSFATDLHGNVHGARSGRSSQLDSTAQLYLEPDTSRTVHR